MSSAPTPVGSTVGTEEFGVLEVAGALVRRWKLITGIPILAAVVTAIVALLLPVKYAAVVQFMPETDARGLPPSGNVASLASQFGIPLGGGGGSPQLYAAVVHSRTLRDSLLLTSFSDPRPDATNATAPLLDVLGVEGENLALRLETGRDMLLGILATRVDLSTNIVRVTVETGFPALSSAAANRIVKLVDDFNVSTRRTNARARRMFVEGQLATADKDLRDLEDDLMAFLERNRTFEQSPALRFEHDRLQRALRIKEELVIGLRRQFEDARIDEVYDTPLITVVDTAVVPQEKSRPRRRVMVVVAFFLAAITSLFIILSAEFVNRAQRHKQAEYRELQLYWAEMKGEIRRALGRGTASPSDRT